MKLFKLSTEAEITKYDDWFLEKIIRATIWSLKKFLLMLLRIDRFDTLSRRYLKLKQLTLVSIVF